MPELTIISTCYKDADKPVVKSEYSQEEKQLVIGRELVSDVKIDNQVDGLISQLETVRIEAKNFLNEN
jgi:hypothetical protein